MIELMQDIFWSRIRSALYKKIREHKGLETFYQWEYIAGRRSKDSKRNNIRLSDKSLNVLEATVEYLNSTEGKDDLLQVEIYDPPENVDDLMDRIQNAKNDKQMKAEIFRVFLKHQNHLLKYLKRHYERSY
jgi:hypothetical protein